MDTNDKSVIVTFLSFALVFVVALLTYPHVYDVVGYMYDIPIGLSIPNLILTAILLFILTSLSRFDNVNFRHGYELCILGIFMPNATMAVITSTPAFVVVIPFVALVAVFLTVRTFSGAAFFKTLASGQVKGFNFVQYRFILTVVEILIIVYALATQGLNLSLNLLDTYFRVYEIREDTIVVGFFGYLLGWFILTFFPIQLAAYGGAFDKRYIAIALLGGLVAFQLFGLKVIFLNFFLLLFFAVLFRARNLLFQHGPVVFFLLIFIIVLVIGDDAYMLLDRFYYLVGLNSTFYIDFFSKNPLRYFEGGLLGFGNEVYRTPAGFIIDSVYYTGLGTNQSAGFLPSIFADLGYFGLVAGGIVVGFLLILIHSLRLMSSDYAYLLSIALCFTLMNHSVNMLFLSNGLVIILFMTYFHRNGAGR